MVTAMSARKVVVEHQPDEIRRSITGEPDGNRLRQVSPCPSLEDVPAGRHLRYQQPVDGHNAYLDAIYQGVDSVLGLVVERNGMQPAVDVEGMGSLGRNRRRRSLSRTPGGGRNTWGFVTIGSRYSRQPHVVAVSMITRTCSTLRGTLTPPLWHS